MKNQIDIYSDPDIIILKSELSSLEKYLNVLINEKAECEKLLSDFYHKHTIELGEIILEILKLRKLKFKTDKIKYEDAESDEEQYKEQVKSEKKKHLYTLTDEQKAELKKKFRNATFLCHPDKVKNDFKDAAEKVFIELKLAYDSNDLKRVSAILVELERENYFILDTKTIKEKDLILSEISKIKEQIERLKSELKEIKSSNTYQEIIDIDDFNEYFKRVKEKLNNEIDELRAEVPK